MQKSAELLSELGDHVDTIKDHLRALDYQSLRELRRNLPSATPDDSAVRLMLTLVVHEIERRVEAEGDNIVSFPDRPRWL